MNLAQMLNMTPTAAVDHGLTRTQKRRSRTPVKFKGSRARYKALMINKLLSTQEIAEGMGYTNEGTWASLHRMVEQGLVRKMGSQNNGLPGRPRTMWKWVGA